MVSLREYYDILSDRRRELSDFLWTSRELHPQIAYRQTSKPTPEWHREQVLKSGKIQDFLNKLSQEQNIPIDLLEQQTRAILDEIGYKKSLTVIRSLGFILVKICKKILSGIYINQNYLLQIKQQMGNCPVIFVPSHRSYADFILMSLVLFNYDIAIPAIAAGMDFHGMVGMGTMLRNTGAFFMRRSYNDDHLYWTTFKQYIYQIVTKGELPIEFFIEGTRSRSNKSLSPKYGLILMILKAFFLSQVPDIVFVPINISYDRILEEKLFAFELLGVPKPKESTSGFFKSLSIIKEKFGSIYFHFCEPISVKQFFGDKLDRSVHNLQPINHQEITEDEKKLVPSLAYQIIKQQQKHCVITIFNIIAILLNNNLTNSQDLLTVFELKQQISWFRTILQKLNVFVPINDIEDDLIEALQIHQNIVKIDEQQRINLIWNNIILDKFNPDILKAHKLSEKTISFCVPFIMLQIYINPLLHYLVDVAVLTVSLKYCQSRATKDEIFRHYHFLRSLFSQEFITFNLWENMEFEEALENCLNLHIINCVDNIYELGDDKDGLQQILCTSLDCFVYSYYQICSVLQTVPNVSGEKLILAQIQEEIEKQIDNKAIFIHPYSLNLDTINNCLNSLKSLGVITKERSKNTTIYGIDTSKLVFVLDKLEHYVPSSQVLQNKLEKLQIHLKNKL